MRGWFRNCYSITSFFVSICHHHSLRVIPLRKSQSQSKSWNQISLSLPFSRVLGRCVCSSDRAKSDCCNRRRRQATIASVRIGIGIRIRLFHEWVRNWNCYLINDNHVNSSGRKQKRETIFNVGETENIHRSRASLIERQTGRKAANASGEWNKELRRLCTDNRNKRIPVSYQRQKNAHWTKGKCNFTSLGGRENKSWCFSSTQSRIYCLRTFLQE